MYPSQDGRMPLVNPPPRRPLSREAFADRVIWALIAATVVVNLALMWRIAAGGG
jgi:hypothetical protein